MKRTLDVEQEDELFDILLNTMNFCGNTIEAVKAFCQENNIDYSSSHVKEQTENVRCDASFSFYVNNKGQ